MSLKDWKVLVVEDEADSMELVREILGFYGIVTIPAGTAEDALETLEDIIPTLIIIDLALPGMDGWGLLKVVQQDHRFDNVPRVAITAYHAAEVSTKTIEAGFDAYFPKPLETTSFVRELQAIIEN